MDRIGGSKCAAFSPLSLDIVKEHQQPTSFQTDLRMPFIHWNGQKKVQIQIKWKKSKLKS